MLYLLWYSVIIFQPDLFAFLRLNAATSYQKHAIIRCIFLHLQREMLKMWSAIPQNGLFFCEEYCGQATGKCEHCHIPLHVVCRSWGAIVFFLELKYSLSAPRLLCLKSTDSWWIDFYLLCTANLDGPCEVWTELGPRLQTLMYERSNLAHDINEV